MKANDMIFSIFYQSLDYSVFITLVKTVALIIYL